MEQSDIDALSILAPFLSAVSKAHEIITNGRPSDQAKITDLSTQITDQETTIHSLFTQVTDAQAQLADAQAQLATAQGVDTAPAPLTPQ